MAALELSKHEVAVVTGALLRERDRLRAIRNERTESSRAAVVMTEAIERIDAILVRAYPVLDTRV